MLAQREAQRGQEDAVLLGAKLNSTFRGVAVWSSVTAVFGFHRVKSKTEMPQHDTENSCAGSWLQQFSEELSAKY